MKRNSGKKAVKETSTAKAQPVMLFEVKGKGKRLEAVLIDPKGKLYHDSGVSVRPIPYEKACVELARMYQRFENNEQLEWDSGSIRLEVRWFKMVADYAASRKGTSKQAFESIKEWPRVYLTHAEWEKLGDYMDATGEADSDVVTAGLQHVYDRHKIGQDMERCDADPKALKVIFRFHSSFPNEYNALLMDGKELYWVMMMNEEEIFEAGLRMKVADATPEVLHPVSVKEALAWYARCMPWSTDSDGTMAEVCELAAKL